MAQVKDVINNHAMVSMPTNHEAIDYRIDASVKPNSYWRALFVIMFMMCILGVAMLSDLAWWMLLSLVLLSIVAVVVMYMPAKLLVNITSAPLYHLDAQGLKSSHGKWQLLWQTFNNQQLWEARLIQCQHYGRCIQLSFLVTHPIPKNISVIIWQDQVDADTWRRLNGIARW